MKSVEFTDLEARLVHEVFSEDFGPLFFDEIRAVAESVGLMSQIGTDNYDSLVESILKKTECARGEKHVEIQQRGSLPSRW
jgi:hypothetical protein